MAQLLDENDSIHFSIDGYDNNSNNLYRVNSDYDSIMLGIATVRKYSTCKIVWAAIAFKFNEDHIDNMRDQAHALGVDVFQLTKSTKFGSVYPSYGHNDPLQPSVKFISSSYRFEREMFVLTENGKPNAVSPTNITLYKKIKPRNGITPLCEIGNKGLYIDARGRLFPCCWVANRYNHNSDWQQQAENFNLNNRLLVNVLADDFWNTELQTFHWQECQTKCKTSVVDEKYATLW